MIKSMTGYGRGESMTSSRKITVEIKSLNSKQLDLSVRIPSIYREKESEIRSAISKSLSRGKVDLIVTYENLQQQTETGSSINIERFASYYKQIMEAAAIVGCEPASGDVISSVLRMSDVLQSDVAKISDDELGALLEAMAGAVTSINDFRAQEGRVLMDDLLARVDLIENLMEQVVPFEAERIETVRTRIMDNLAKINVNMDNNRFEQEIIYYLEKFDITEEKVRLKQHCDYFRAVAAEDEGVGRKLGFISQEMGREINTMGSKANHAQIQKIVVDMKDELEKIKEQLLNIL